MPSSATLLDAPRSNGLLGSTTPRIWTPPLVVGRRKGPCGCGCFLTSTTTHGFRAVEFARDVLEIELFPWQRWLLIHALELAPWGGFRFRTVLILVARQAGKTSVIEVKNLFKMFVLQVPLIIGTAQNLETSEESWDNAVATVEGIPELYEEVADPKDGRGIVRVNGKKSLKLKSGSRWKIAAASRRGGRGLSGDDVNLDELREHHNWDSWSAVTKTTMARERAQVYGFSNAGDIRSVVLNELQEKGRAAAANPATADSSLGYFEWSSPEGCALDDWPALAQANPSLGYPGGVSEVAIRAAMATDPEAVYRTEVMCQQVLTLAPQWDVVTEGQWEALLDVQSSPRDPVVFAADVNYEGTAGAIGIAGLRGDGLEHVEAPDDLSRDGISWMVPRLCELRDKQKPLAVVIDPVGKAAALIPELERRGFQAVASGERADRGRTALVRPTTREVTTAFGEFVGAVTEERSVRHRGDRPLVEALAGATTRKVGDSGAEAWARKTAAVNIAPLVAVTMARWCLLVRLGMRRPASPRPVTDIVAGRSETGDLSGAGF